MMMWLLSGYLWVRLNIWLNNDDDDGDDDDDNDDDVIVTTPPLSVAQYLTRLCKSLSFGFLMNIKD